MWLWLHPLRPGCQASKVPRIKQNEAKICCFAPKLCLSFRYPLRGWRWCLCHEEIESIGIWHDSAFGRFSLFTIFLLLHTAAVCNKFHAGNSACDLDSSIPSWPTSRFLAMASTASTKPRTKWPSRSDTESQPEFNTFAVNASPSGLYSCLVTRGWNSMHDHA